MGRKTSQKGQGNAGGWPATSPGQKSGGNRSNNPPSTNRQNPNLSKSSKK